MPRPIHCEVSVAALRHNLERVVSYGQKRKNWAVVKANAYGHGLAEAVSAFALADGLALVEFDYAVQLRKLGWRKPILMLEGAFSYADTELARRQNLSLVVHQVRQLQWLEQSAVSAPVSVWLKLNTGMNRLGFSENSIETLKHTLTSGGARLRHGIDVIGAMTHFANSDVHLANAHLMPEAQIETLLKMLKALDGIEIDALSISNSSAILGYTDLDQVLTQHLGRVDIWQRPGIMLYGATPYADLATQSSINFDLKPAMALSAEVLSVQQVQAGESIGYGSRFVAKQAMTAAVIACGYADGYPRQAPDGTPVMIDSVRCPLTGRVSMDMMVVDVSAVPNCTEGSIAQLWGAQLPIDEVAQMAGTIGYELMCAVAARVERRRIESFLS